MNKSVIIGTLLGDAWIQKRDEYYSFNFQQVNEEYCRWKAQVTELDHTISNYVKFDKRTNKYYKITNCYLKLNKEIKKEYYNLFYNPEKVVNEKILNLVDDFALAIWYMDDGNCYYNGNNCHITLSINGFKSTERQLIINWFKNKYDLEFKINQKAIRLVSKKECIKFMNIIEEYIPECMGYKKLSNTINKYRSGKNILHR